MYVWKHIRIILSHNSGVCIWNWQTIAASAAHGTSAVQWAAKWGLDALCDRSSALVIDTNKALLDLVLTERLGMRGLAAVAQQTFQ